MVVVDTGFVVKSIGLVVGIAPEAVVKSIGPVVGIAPGTVLVAGLVGTLLVVGTALVVLGADIGFVVYQKQ